MSDTTETRKQCDCGCGRRVVFIIEHPYRLGFSLQCKHLWDAASAASYERPDYEAPISEAT